ncbi:MAG: FKBP-type peptidyl-prolyl cis-trans isomerase [Bacteroidales bacterium]|nr:FKBP-type peptidyl-prolyl cis-trans isomerase [Bacteroidales bacterium]
MKKLSFIATLFLVAAVVLSSCGDKKYKGFKQADNGVWYKVIEKGQGTATPKVGDYIFIVASYTSSNDSIPKFEEKELSDVMREHAFEGDIFDAYAIMHEGDKMEFAIKADSFYMAIGAPAEALKEMNITEEDVLYFTIKMKEIKSVEQFQAEEAAALQQYIQENNITVEPTESGLYFIQTQEGKGPKAEDGNNITVHYVGKFLDGTTFDSSVDRGEPMQVELGSQPFIAGFEEAVKMMNAGSKATVIMPSNIAYGPSSPYSPIPPFTTLVFDLEMISIK